MRCKCGKEFERDVVMEVKGRIYRIYSCRCGRDRAYEIPAEEKELWKKALNEKQ